ncbi:2-amino-4-hydroxy-6-hydroxymethyldihydropteridine diphosphokinase [Thermomonas flagellata]|uniref:2-amino-4-hydroxy-6- hydroxymethyldihydropteridine diphosphokinase n=1 Tax=Thermomonas flagellata TaxID=2888524 RepID=UPI001F0441E6|nr:2-amino-4-hydroxy-6-hydroxymethyldihydropteridine diphosphokinase [Thermomonas flagellata]
MGRAYLSLGSNLEPQRHLRAAVQALRARFPLLALSPAYRFPAVGFSGPDFLNAAAVIDSDLPPEALDAWLHALEDAHGRDRSGPRYGDRTLDIDIVLYDDRVLDGPGHLRLPRPELRHAFVLKPLAEIAPDAVEPRSGQTLAALWRAHPQHAEAFPAEPL